MMRISYKKYSHYFLDTLQGFHEKTPWNHEVKKNFSEGLAHRGDVKFVSCCLPCFMVE
jgi:hypothetical protein